MLYFLVDFGRLKQHVKPIRANIKHVNMILIICFAQHTTIQNCLKNQSHINNRVKQTIKSITNIMNKISIISSAYYFNITSSVH